MNLTEKLTGVIRTIATKVRADEDTPKSESIQVYLDIDYSDCTTEDVLQFACADRRIAWANGGSGRKAISQLSPGMHIKVKASSPGVKGPQSAMDILIANAAASGRTVTEQFEFERKARGL